MSEVELNGKKLEFPVDWEFRIIVETAGEEAALAAIRDTFARRGLNPVIGEGQSSASGTYKTFQVPATMESREMLDGIAAELAAIDGVKYLI